MNFARWKYSPPRSRKYSPRRNSFKYTPPRNSFNSFKYTPSRNSFNSFKYTPPRNSFKYTPPRNLKEFSAKRDSSVGCENQNFGHSSNLANGKLMVSHAQESECNMMIGVNPSRENAKVDFAHRKYSPRDYPVGRKDQKFNYSGKLIVADDQMKSRENECNGIGASNLANGKLMVAHDQMKSGESDSNVIGVNPLKENAIVDFAPRKYPPPRIFKGFSLKRDFPIGCKNEKFSHCGKLMVDYNQTESGESECNMIGVSNLSNGNLVVAHEVKLGESEYNIGVSNLSNGNLVVSLAHDEVKSEESESKIIGINPLKENAKKDFAPRKYPPPRILKGFSLRRDFPIGFESQKFVDFPNEMLMEEIEELEAIDHEIKSREMLMEEIEPLQAIDHEIKSRESELDMICANTLKENARLDCVSRKFPLTNERSMVEIKPKEVGDEIDLNIRDKMKAALQSFQDIVNNFMQEGATSAGPNILMKAAVVLREQSKWIYTSKRIGPIPGVEVGDMFQWVTEMNVIGLHNQFLRGIDHLKIDGKVIAISVVASGRYSNNVNYSDVVVYSGQGENPGVTVKRKQQLEDQKLEGGNLALKNSMEEKTPVRVVRSLKLSRRSTYIGMSGRRIFKKVYFYDGLYLVDRYWQERGKFGKLVFMFWLKRIEGQPKCTFWEKSEFENSTLKKENDIFLQESRKGLDFFR